MQDAMGGETVRADSGRPSLPPAFSSFECHVSDVHGAQLLQCPWPEVGNDLLLG